MEKKRSGLSARGKQAVRNVKHIPDRRIDFSDIPESTAEELKRARRVGRPGSGTAKQLIAVRGGPKMLALLRGVAAELGEAYPTFVHEVLGKGPPRAAWKVGGRGENIPYPE